MIKYVLSGISLLAIAAAFNSPAAIERVSAAASQAGTVIVVTVTTDDFIQNGNCTLREAVQAANSDQARDACPAGNGVDTIQLPVGIIQPSLPASSNEDPGVSEGDINVIASVNIVGQGRGQPLLMEAASMIGFSRSAGRGRR